MEGGHHRLQRWPTRYLVDVYRDAAPIVGDHDRAVLLDDYCNGIAKASHGLVHSVVHYLVNQVVKASLVGAANVHTGSTAHRL
jgi:hypothetical protein